MALPEGVINGAFAETAVVRPLLSFFFLPLCSDAFPMIAFFGESLASCTDITGGANATPRGFHASVY
jgi:hypothetical protein